jgi:hypothetical protein
MAATIAPNDPTFSERRETSGRRLLLIIDIAIARLPSNQKLLR